MSAAAGSERLNGRRHDVNRNGPMDLTPSMLLRRRWGPKSFRVIYINRGHRHEFHDLKDRVGFCSTFCILIRAPIMDTVGATSSILGIAHVGVRAVSGLYSLADAWPFAPEEIHQLRDTIARFCRLLEHGVQAGRDAATNTARYHRSVQGLNEELHAAMRVLSRLEAILDDVRAVSSSDSHALEFELPSEATMKARWSIHKDDASRLHADLTNIHHRILAQLAILNVSVSTGVAVEQPIQSSHLGGIQHSPNTMVSRINRLPPDKSSSEKMSQNVEQKVLGHLQRQKPREMQHRNVQNEQRFQHLEVAFSAMMKNFNSYGGNGQLSYPFPTTSRSVRVSQQTYDPPDCKCKCHTSHKSWTTWSLSAFKSTLGAFSMRFTGRLRQACDVASCTTHNTKRLQVVYTFPTWLFHAAVAATYSDDTHTGSPELIIRVLHRISITATTPTIVGAVMRGEVDTVRGMMQRREGSIYDVRGDNGSSLLSSALQKRNFQVVELLLQGGADMFQLDDRGRAAFHYAVQTMYAGPPIPSRTRQALEDALPLDTIIEHSGLTELHKAVMGISCFGVWEYMSSRGRDHRAITDGEINLGDASGQTPLYYASARGDHHAVHVLLGSGAMVNLCSAPEFDTPLYVACHNGHLRVVQMLIDAGADINARNRYKTTPLHTLVSNFDSTYHDVDGYMETIRKLLLHGADINAVDAWQSTILDLAALHNQGVLIDFIIDSGADLNHRDWEGTNVLGNAIYYNAHDAIVTLLRRGVDYRNIDDHGIGTLHYAAMAGNARTMELLADAGLEGMDVDRQDNQGRTALQLFNGRADAREQDLRQAFEHMLITMSRLNDGAGKDTESDSDEEFFEAPAYLSGLDESNKL